MTKWIITKDFIGTSNVGLQSEEGRSPEGAAKFRLKDNHDEVYYHGECEEIDSFAPLDDFGEKIGCSRLEYFKDGKWEDPLGRTYY